MTFLIHAPCIEMTPVSAEDEVSEMRTTDTSSSAVVGVAVTVRRVVMMGT
jgi:hypothetical protein